MAGISNEKKNSELRLKFKEDTEYGLFHNATPLFGIYPKELSHANCVFKPSFHSLNSIMDNNYQSEESLENFYFTKEPKEKLPHSHVISETKPGSKNPPNHRHSNEFAFPREKPAKIGLTWAKWTENCSPKDPLQCQQIKKLNVVCNQSALRVTKTETSEETLRRRVQSTARLWDTDSTINANPLKRKSNVPPSLETTPEKRFARHCNQNLSRHYNESSLIKKRCKFPPK